MPGGKISDFSESTALATVPEKPTREERRKASPSIGEKLTGSVQSAVDRAKEAGEAAKGAVKGIASGVRPSKSKEERMAGAAAQPDPMLQWVMQYLKEEQQTVKTRDATSLLLVQEILQGMKETTKEQKALNTLIEETMSLIGTTIQEERRKSQAKAWWEWIRDVLIIVISAGSFVKLGQISTQQQMLIGQQYQPQISRGPAHLRIAKA